MQNAKRRTLLIVIGGFLFGILVGGVSYNLLSEFHIAQRATATYAFAQENLEKGNSCEALVLFSMSAGIKPNYESYHKIGTIYSQLGLGPAATVMLERSLVLLERKEMIIALEDRSLLLAKTKIREELERARER